MSIAGPASQSSKVAASWAFSMALVTGVGAVAGFLLSGFVFTTVEGDFGVRNAIVGGILSFAFLLPWVGLFHVLSVWPSWRSTEPPH